VRSRSLWVVIVIVLAGALLRLIGAGFGLPAVYNPDEVAIMNRTMALAPNRLNPGNFLYPSFYFYALFAWEGLLFVTGWVAGRFASLAAFEYEFFTDPSIHYLAGRLLTALCGTATVAATWLFGRRLFGSTAGLVAAALLAVAPLAVRDAHYVKHDVPVTLLIVLAHLALATRAGRDASANAGRGLGIAGCLAAALAGLALSTHYYAVFVFVPLVLLLAWPGPGTPPRDRLSQTAAALVIAGLVFVAASPFLVIEAQTTWRDVVANREIVVDRATDQRFFGSIGFYLSWLMGEASGRLAALLALAGIVVVVRSGVTTAVLTLAFPVTFILFVSNTAPASRYLNPVLPFGAILAGGAIAWIASNKSSGARLLAGGLAAAAILEAAAASVHTVRFFGMPDTRTLAQGWIEATIAQESTVLLQPYSVPIRQSREGLREALTVHLGDAGRASVRFERQLALEPYPAPAYRTIYFGSGGLDVDKLYIEPAEVDRAGSLEPLRRLGVTHVVLKRYNVADPAMASLEQALAREARLDATFTPYRAEAGRQVQQRVAPFLHNTDARIDSALERPGPIIEIWTIE
jgi:hypothetical protein